MSIKVIKEYKINEIVQYSLIRTFKQVFNKQPVELDSVMRGEIRHICSKKNPKCSSNIVTNKEETLANKKPKLIL